MFVDGRHIRDGRRLQSVQQRSLHAAPCVPNAHAPGWISVVAILHTNNGSTSMDKKVPNWNGKSFFVVCAGNHQ